MKNRRAYPNPINPADLPSNGLVIAAIHWLLMAGTIGVIGWIGILILTKLGVL